ncbi:MAG: hypothetical protein RMM28_08830 [Thermoleophilia bacterium]|nr:hypothetical protein [Gaiellaceae bacterium]MDW8339228.1 hypothetical protein [Thermoleophilia bacterium]
MLALAAVLASLTLAPPAAAASDCGKKVLGDWFDNGRIDRLYPLHCYEDAIDLIPKDLLPYADAEEVISRALQQALRDQLAPGGCDPSPDGSENDCGPRAPGTSPGKGSKGTKSRGQDPPAKTTDAGETSAEAVPDVDTGAAASVPIPLLVLGGMSVALLAAGGLGYVSRRRQSHARELGDDDPSG